MSYTATCAICREDIMVYCVNEVWQSSDEDVKVMSCRHAMHKSCFQGYEGRICPTCRVVWIKKEEPLYFNPPLIYDYSPAMYPKLFELAAVSIIVMTAIFIGIVLNTPKL